VNSFEHQIIIFKTFENVLQITIIDIRAMDKIYHLKSCVLFKKDGVRCNNNNIGNICVGVDGGVWTLGAREYFSPLIIVTDSDEKPSIIIL